MAWHDVRRRSISDGRCSGLSLLKAQGSSYWLGPTIFCHLAQGGQKLYSFPWHCFADCILLNPLNPDDFGTRSTSFCRCERCIERSGTMPWDMSIFKIYFGSPCFSSPINISNLPQISTDCAPQGLLHLIRTEKHTLSYSHILKFYESIPISAESGSDRSI